MFEPLSPPLDALSRGVKASFDPDGVFNFGRMYRGRVRASTVMQTHFSPEPLADPHTRALEKILRSCVHCGFCTATCPTYVVAGDERDSPRGRIYLIKDLLETGRAPTEDVVGRSTIASPACPA